MDRGCITYSIAYLAGIYIAGAFHFHYLTIFFTTLLLIPICFIFRKEAMLFTAFSHLAMFSAGVGNLVLANTKVEYNNSPFICSLNTKAASLQDNASTYLKNFASSPNNHSILCALTVGKKNDIGKDLKQAYSNAGALHILALSGLHVGIMYSIVQTILYPLKLLPAAKFITDGISILFILLYMVISGCSPSVMRAGTMIIIYKIGKISYRDIGKWDAIALSALILGMATPLQVTGIGFQLSYAAVIGISLLYPTFYTSFTMICRQPAGLWKYPYLVILKLWDSMSISVCCQIATLPVLLFHFGENAQYFIITNLIAIPLATAILYAFVLAFLLQWIPFAGTPAVDLLNLLINIMNNCIIYISS